MISIQVYFYNTYPFTFFDTKPIRNKKNPNNSYHHRWNHRYKTGYTPLQTIVSTILNEERKRLTAVLQESLTPEDKSALEKLLINENIVNKKPLGTNMLQ